MKSQQLLLNVRQGTFLHHTLGDILVRAVVVPTIHLNTANGKFVLGEKAIHSHREGDGGV